MSENKERLLDLSEIIRMTGHRSEQAAYTMLRKHGQEPAGYRPATRAPRAVYSEKVVREVFAKHLETARRIREMSLQEAV